MTSIRRRERRWKLKAILGGTAAIFAVLALLAILVGLPGYVGYREIEDLRQEQKAYDGYDPTIDGVNLRGSAPSFAEAELKKPRENRATCKSPYSREDADLCAQWAAVKAVSTGNGIAITGLRSTLLGTLVTAVGILLTAVGLVIATLTSRDATRAVRAMENLERGYVTVSAAAGTDGNIALTLGNIGRTPVWIGSAIDDGRGILQDRERNGLCCVPAGEVYDIEAEPATGANPGIVRISVVFTDVLDQVRTVDAILKMADEVWRLADLREREGK